MAAIKPFPISGFATVLGSQLNLLVTAINNLTGNGTAQPVTATTLTATGLATMSGGVAITGSSTIAGPIKESGLWSGTPQVLTAAGTTQLGAAAITASLALISVAATASTHGVRLPVASTGLSVTVGNLGAFGAKVYPATNGKIGAASTNAADATVLAVNKANTYTALNTTLWVVQRGA